MSLNPPRTSQYGRYVSEEYNHKGTTFSAEWTDTTQLGRTTKGKGAWGWIENRVNAGISRPDAIIQYLGLHDCTGTFINAPSKTLAEETIRTHINQGRPVIARTQLSPAGHYVVITGYQETTEGLRYHVNDPYGIQPYTTTATVQHLDQPVTYTYEEMQLGLSSRGLITIVPKTSWYNFKIESVEIQNSGQPGIIDATITISSETTAQNVPLGIYLISESGSSDTIKEIIIDAFNAGETRSLTERNIRHNNQDILFHVNPDQSFPEHSYTDNSYRVHLAGVGRQLWKEVTLDGRMYRIYVQNYAVTPQTTASDIARDEQSRLDIEEIQGGTYRKITEPSTIAALLNRIINEEYQSRPAGVRPHYEPPDENLIVGLIIDSDGTHSVNFLQSLDVIGNLVNHLFKDHSEAQKEEILSNIILQALYRESDQANMQKENTAALTFAFIDAFGTITSEHLKTVKTGSDGLSPETIKILLGYNQMKQYGFDGVKAATFYSIDTDALTPSSASTYMQTEHILSL
jgi:hypothetical protein